MMTTIRPSVMSANRAVKNGGRSLLNKLKQITAISTVMISSAALLGWWTDHTVLAIYLPGISNMTFNTALCFMLVALACSMPDRDVQPFVSIRFGVGVLVGLVAVLSLSQDFFGLRPGIDNLLFESHGYGLTGPYPGRMSPLTAAGLLFIGTALALLSVHHNRSNRFVSATHALILLAGMVGLTGIGINLLVTASASKAYAHLSSISLFAATSLLLLATALISIFQQRCRKSGTNLLLHSGIELMYKLKYPQKFALISIILIVPMAFLMRDAIRLAKHNVASARLEIGGIEHIRRDVDLLKAIPEHRGMVNARFSDPSLFRQKLPEKTAQIDRLLNEHSRMNQLQDKQLHSLQGWAEITANWASVKENLPDRSRQWQLHTEIIAMIARHLRDEADESGLTFDETPLLHNLLVAQLQVMPRLLEQIGQLRGQGVRLISNNNISRDEQLMLDTMVSRTGQSLQEMTQLLTQASATQNTKILADMFSNMADATHKFIATVKRQFIADGGFPLSAEAYFKQGTAAIDQGYQLYDVSLGFVEQQLQQRIHRLLMKQYNIKLTAMWLAIVLLFLFASFYRSVMNTIQALDSIARNMRSGDMDKLPSLPTNDELGSIVESFNTVAGELVRISSFMSAVVDHAADGIITIDTEGTIKSFNPASERMFGYKARKVVGQNITMLIPEQYRERHLAGLQRYCETGDGRMIGTPTEVHGLRKNGDEFPMQLSINVMFINNRQMFLGMVRDTTQHREIENQLRHAQKMETVGALVGGIAHNFNNQLAGIIGKTYMAKTRLREQPEKVLAYLESIEVISLQASDMIKQLLTFARKDFFSTKHNTPLALLIKEGFNTSKLGIPEDINLSLNVTASDVVAFCDATQIQQVLMNLMSNARDAMRDCTKKRIRVSLDVCVPDADFFKQHPELAVGEYACLQVSDSGIGMDEETMQRIFDPFYTTKEVGQGTGLGLSTAFGSITSHEGVIEVDSKPGSGTTFRVYLPVVEAPETKTRRSAQSFIPSSGHGALLLVDDEPLILHAMQEVFEEFGYQVITARNGTEGLTCFQQFQRGFDAIITDVVMPEMGGVEMFREIRCMNSTVPTVFMTGYDQGNVQLQANEKENTAVISKPVEIPELLRLLQHILRKEKSYLSRKKVSAVA
ncbi:MAG: PAS domain S-box protein [Mariprofundaceae bacterium]|nr:PAS domain S-box protein [Mariprofundaceae bacterium]